MLKNTEIRNSFINYFQKNSHTLVKSSSLIPENDPTLLFANAGMNQFKNTFLGLEKREYNKAVSVQKCVRAGGKHNDLDNVGFTARHHTFFEMLGNFSFGDYFKKEAIHYAWQFLTNELKIPKEKLYVTVFESDDEAADLWQKEDPFLKGRIFRLGEKDNFWRMGDIGPCGPSTEIFYDHGPKAGSEADPYKGILSGQDRFIEIWNLVFMQYYEEAPGKMTALPKPSVDTGSGFERLVAALQGQYANYDTDLFLPMIERASVLAKQNYASDPELLRQDPVLRDRVAAMRVLADHCRSTSFLLADGAMPSNEGRGYVLRRIMRRAIRYGRKLSTETSFLPELSEILISHMGSFYPELQNRKDTILQTIKEEENRFLQTLDNGSAILNDELLTLKKQNQKIVSGETLFKLYDTYGFPVDLTAVIAAEHGLQVDEDHFEKVMTASKEKAKSSWKGKSIQSDEKHMIEFTEKYLDKATDFVGYDKQIETCKIIALSNGTQEVSTLNKGETGFLITDKTPFYAEGGGQVGDQGYLQKNSIDNSSKNSINCARVLNTTKSKELYIQHIEVIDSSISINDHVVSLVDQSERRQITANHTATHLMHAALKKVLGDSVNQAGSLVDSSKTRFDFTYNKPLTSDEIEKIEFLVNEQIQLATPVEATIMPHSEAIKSGAMALFGEKYGDKVRVLKIAHFSCELCGGTHVKNTSEIRVFKIASESGVSAGVRRIEAITGLTAIEMLFKNNEDYQQSRLTSGILADKSLNNWINDKKEEIKELNKQIKKLQAQQINIDELINSGKSFESKNGTAKLIFADLSLDDRDVLSTISDQLKNKVTKGIIVIIGKGETSHPVIISVSKDLTSEFKAGDLLKTFALHLGGKGGGRPDFAQGAVPDRSQLDKAILALSQGIMN